MSSLLLFWITDFSQPADPLPVLYIRSQRLFDAAVPCVPHAEKYRMALPPPGTRLLWYFYYIPLIMIPTLFLMICVHFHTAKNSPPKETVLLVPAGIFAGIVVSGRDRVNPATEETRTGRLKGG